MSPVTKRKIQLMLHIVAWLTLLFMLCVVTAGTLVGSLANPIAIIPAIIMLIAQFFMSFVVGVSIRIAVDEWRSLK